MIEAARESLAPLLVGGTLLAVILGMMLTVRTRRRRVEAARAWAQGRGWQYQSSSPELHEEFSGPPFGRGHTRTAEHVLTGTHADRAVVCFDYRYVTASGSGARGDRHEDTHHHAVIAMRFAPRDEAGPVMELEPRPAVVGDGLDEAGPGATEEFDRVFAVRCSEPDRARVTLGPGTRSLLLQRPRHRWRLDGLHLRLVREGEVDLRTLDADLDLAAAVLDSLAGRR